MRVEEERMKESGKLIELLNEYIEEKELGNTVKEIDDDYFVNNYNNWDGYLCEQVISKKFGFIKWLVDNDKIDLDMVKEKLGIPCFTRYSEGEIISVKDVEDYKQLLMLLSISDTPIEDLVSYLK